MGGQGIKVERAAEGEEEDAPGVRISRKEEFPRQTPPSE
jgi:hypothetical protein